MFKPQEDELAISNVPLCFAATASISVKSLKSLQRNCLGYPIDDTDDTVKYLSDEIVHFCMKEALEAIDVDFASRCKILYPTLYKGEIDSDGVGSAIVSNVFIKNYILIPIGKCIHWSLCIVCHPVYYLIHRYKAHFTPVQNKAFENILNSKHKACIIFLDSLPGIHKFDEISREVTLWFTKKWIQYTRSNLHKAFEDLLTDCISSDQYNTFVQWMSTEILPLYDKDKDFNMFESMECMDGDLGLRQDNGFDCGYYVTMNAKAFLSAVESSSLKAVIRKGRFKGWFSYDDVASNKRDLLNRLMNSIPEAVLNPSTAQLAKILNYLHPNYDSLKKDVSNGKHIGATAVQIAPPVECTSAEQTLELPAECTKAIMSMLVKRRALESAIESVTKRVREFYTSKTKCESNKEALKNVVKKMYAIVEKDSQEGDKAVNQIVLDMVSRSFPEKDDAEDEFRNLSQSCSAFLSQSTNTSDSVSAYVPSTQDSVDEVSSTPPKRKQPKRQSKATASESSKLVNKVRLPKTSQNQFSHYTTEFISQHTTRLFTFLYPERTGSPSTTSSSSSEAAPATVEMSSPKGAGSASTTSSSSSIGNPFVRKVKFNLDSLQDSSSVQLKETDARTFIQEENPETYQLLKDKSFEAQSDKRTGQVGIAVNISDSNLVDKTKDCPFIYLIFPIHRNTGNYVKIGSAVFYQGDRRMFLSRMKTFCPASYIVF